MKGDVIVFPVSKIKPARPNAIQVQFNFGEWTLAYYWNHQFRSRLSFSSKAAAEAEAARLEAVGMTWRKGQNGTVYIMPDGTDGGCWAVAHRSRSEDSDALIGRHFSLDAAVDDAIRVARETGAEFSLHEQSTDGGAA